MDFKTFSEEELNTFSKEMIITLYLQLTSSFQIISKQNEQIMEQNEQQTMVLLTQIDNLKEQIAILTNYRFGRKTEKSSDILDGQMVLEFDGQPLILNEIEWEIDHSDKPEKTDEELLNEAKERAEKRKRKKGVREEDFKNAKIEIREYTIPEEELNELFPDGYKELGIKTSYRVEYEPAKLLVYEEHIHTYKSVKEDRFVYADHPKHLLSHSYLSPSLAAKVWKDKFINAIPVNRISRDIGWLDVVIRPPTMSRWMINLTNRYLMKIYELMKSKLLEARLIHADETPFICEEDRKKEGRTKNSKSYMWVYHTADQYGSPPIFIYEYKDNRRKENVELFLSGYKGILMADGYEPYHIVARLSNGDIVVAGCWAHLKRKFMEVIKTDPKNAKGTIAYEGNKKIAEIYHVDNKMKDAPEEVRLAYRMEKVQPFVDEFFEWVKKYTGKVATEGTQKALTYAINQEIYLRVFISSGIIPLDNSDAERSIRSFCVGKHSWHITASSRGAETSGILYSIAETVKANGLKPYEYFKYLLEQMLEHEKNIDEMLPSLVPWSKNLPDFVRVTEKFKA